jgi:acetyl-CoA C-acetyltransferase
MLSRLLRSVIDPLGASARQLESLSLGCPFPEGAQGLNLARTALIGANRPEMSGRTLSSFGASGLDAVLDAVGLLAAGAPGAVAAGIQLTSRVPYGGSAFSAALSYDLLQRDAFWPKHLAAHSFAESCGLATSALDEAASARLPGLFSPLAGFALSADAGAAPLVRTGAPILATTPPLYSETGGPVLFRDAHAAISCDGAAALVFGRDGALPSRPLAYVRAVASAGAGPTRAPEALVTALGALLQRAGVSAGAVDLWLLDESFVAVPVGVAKRLGVPAGRVNPRGGALACGYCPGAEGLRLVGEAALALAAGGGRLAAVGAWSEGGTASALLLEPS